MPLQCFAAEPDSVFVIHDRLTLQRADGHGGGRWTTRGVELRVVRRDEGQDVFVCCPSQPISWILIRWRTVFSAETLFLGDAWERGYGDLQWRHRQPDRLMPWYFLAHDARRSRTWGVGVDVQPNSFCSWMVDDEGISCWVDLRNGGGSVMLGARELHAATLRARTFEGPSAFQAARQFCGELCPSPRRGPAQPICGNNNWYYAYGEGFDADAIRRDAGFLAEISSSHANRPYCVIDAGWTPGGVNPGGPWHEGDPVKFPDMPALAKAISEMGVHPGLWVRLTAMRADQTDCGRLHTGPHPAPEHPLDLTREDNLATIAADVARIRHWGYKLLKHDFSTYDCFGRWGFEMGIELTNAGWSFADRSLTNAEILLRFYRLIRQHAGDMVVLGCNTVGHLAAGLVDSHRVGDDTSGKNWERTRRMGINSLAFRLPQHGQFFGIDADCVAHTPQTNWTLDRQFLDLVARSGTSLFVSVNPADVSADKKAAFRSAMLEALSGGTGALKDVEPLDWLYSSAPARWRIGSDVVEYQWTEATGVSPFKC